MSNTIRRSCLAFGAMSLISAAVVQAQGTISLQGWGYPPGQLTTRASSTGGSLAEFDQAGPLNPASLLNWGVAGAYMQYAPERRSTSVNGVAVKTTTARFPIMAVGLPLGQKYAFGISSSTLLERNFTSTTTARQLIRTDSVTTTSVTTARGAMNAVQFAGAMQVKSWLRVGTGLQVITGENRVNTVRSIAADTGVVRADTVNYRAIQEPSTATFSGAGLSFGVEVSPTKKLSIAGSARYGFGLRAELNDSVRRSADVPSRVGVGVRWEVAGTNLAARYNWENWSAMRGLGESAGGVFDTQEYGIGTEVPGPKIRGGQVILRLGARRRDLPFGVGGVQPTESTLGGGLGLPIGFGRAQLDLGVDRASRKLPGASAISENGVIFSFGFRLRT